MDAGVRWSDYLSTLEPRAAVELANQFTLGCARLALAARLHLGAASATVVLSTIASSYTALRATLAALDDEAEWEPPTGATGCATDEALARDWRALVRDRDIGEIRHIFDRMEVAVGEVREAAAASIADAPVGEVAAHLRRGVGALVAVREAVLAPSPDP